MKEIHSVAIELDKLKQVYRHSVIADGSRYENSSEHSWHLAMLIMALEMYMPTEINISRAIEISLVHDVCEIGVGDVCAYSKDRDAISAEEALYMKKFSNKHGAFGEKVRNLWEEYEAQQTLESQWVRVADKLQPFLLNIFAQTQRNYAQQMFFLRHIACAYVIYRRLALIPIIYQTVPFSGTYNV